MLFGVSHSLLLFLLVLCTNTSSRFIYIDSVNGTDSTECYKSGAMKPCQSLDWAFASRSNSTTYVLSQNTHFLNGPLAPFNQLSDISFIGSGGSYDGTIIHCTTNTAGMAFHNVVRVSFSNVTVFNCSALRNSTSRNFHHNKYMVYQFFVGLYFVNCLNASFNHVSVDHTPCGTGVVMYNVFGYNSISHSSFTNNVADCNHMPGGGGFYIEFTYCIPGDMRCNVNQLNVKSYFANNTNSKYFFDNCSFTNNVAHSADFATGPANSTFIVPYRSDHEAFGRGGGLSIFLKANASRNIFSVTECTFENNAALWGGGFFVEFHDDTFNNSVFIKNSTMTNNYCHFEPNSGTAGGGMRIGHYVYGNKDDPIMGIGNNISVFNCTFDGNAALDGGGLSISPTSEYVQPCQLASINIENSHFFNNFGKLGAALHIDRFVMILEGYMLKVNVQNCEFSNNSINYVDYIRERFNEDYYAFQIGAGAVFVNQVPLSFSNEVQFTSNIGSALAAVSTGVRFVQCIATFIHNKGHKGGAIALLGAAYLIVDQDTSFLFKENTAALFGGAIYNLYIERENLISYTNCFIRHVNQYLRPEDWNTKFEFYNNTDKEHKRINAISTTSILPCSRAGGSGISKDLETIFCWNALTWVYWPGNCTSQILSDVGEISSTLATENSSGYQVEAFPGQEFTLPLRIKDDLGKSIGDMTVFGAAINATNVSYLWNQQATLWGLENTLLALRLDTLSERVWEVNINVELQPCPPGFKLENSKCVCAGHYIRAIYCFSDNFTAYIKENNWIGNINSHDSYSVSFCPPYYCSNKTVLLPKESSEIENALCTPNHRRGIMCGECISGFGVAVNSMKHECVNCTSANIGRNVAIYIASVYIPLGVLFTLVILFNIRLTSGPANAFILFSQVIAGTFDLDADGQISVSEITGNLTANNLDEAYQVIYGVFNLQFLERFIAPLCIGSLNTLDVFLVKYTVALSPLLMIFIVLVAFKIKEYSSCCKQSRSLRITRVPRFSSKRTISSAILPAFSAFILLSYTKFSIISAHMLLSQPLFDENGNPLEESYRVYYAGQYATDTPQYRKYMIISYVVYGTFVAIPPLALLDFPRQIFEWVIAKSDWLWGHYPADKVQIFLDTFQGCYKNKMRFFAGLYFFFRLVINATYIFTHNWFDQYLVQQIACCVMVALLAICQPYNDNYKVFNIVDILIFTNLGIINALSNYFLSQSNSSQTSIPPFALVTQYALLYLPLVYMLGYVIYFACKKQAKNYFVRKIILFAVQKFRKENDSWLQTFVADRTTNNEHGHESRQTLTVADEDEALLQRAQTRNMYRPVTQTVVDITDAEYSSGIQSELTSSNRTPAKQTKDYGSINN